MTEKFILMHEGKTKGKGLLFNPFGQTDNKERIIAVGFRKFIRDHISASQYYALLRELTQDLEIVDLEIGGKIVVKEDQLHR